MTAVFHNLHKQGNKQRNNAEISDAYIGHVIRNSSKIRPPGIRPSTLSLLLHKMNQRVSLAVSDKSQLIDRRLFRAAAHTRSLICGLWHEIVTLL